MAYCDLPVKLLRRGISLAISAKVIPSLSKLLILAVGAIVGDTVGAIVVTVLGRIVGPGINEYNVTVILSKEVKLRSQVIVLIHGNLERMLTAHSVGSFQTYLMSDCNGSH